MAPPESLLTLGDLFEVFDRLDCGDSVSLVPAIEKTPLPSKKEAWLELKSSGTTGSPKCFWHRWADLRREAIVAEEMRGWTWASPFRPDSFAGVQVALQAWASGGRCLDLRVPWTEVVSRLIAYRPEALCCTPTFLNLLLLGNAGSSLELTSTNRSTADGDTTSTFSGIPKTHFNVGFDEWGVSLRQITLGGEPLRRGTGLEVQRRLPGVRFTIVYAASELGIIAKTRRADGWFDLADLGRRWKQWRVTDGVLEVYRSGNWQSTGDEIEVTGETFRVHGRRGAMANVGGFKVSLPEVESLANEVEGVWSASAWPEANPITGQIVALEFSVLPGREPKVVEAALAHHLQARLPKPAWPRRWECVSPLLGPNAKQVAHR